MPLFRPNLDCTIRRRTGTNVYGEEILSAAVSGRCSIVKFEALNTNSSVRADSSASRGAAREIVVTGELLFPVNTALSFDDQVTVAGYVVRVTGIFPRHNIAGQFDHLQVTVTSWGPV